MKEQAMNEDRYTPHQKRVADIQKVILDAIAGSPLRDFALELARIADDAGLSAIDLRRDDARRIAYGIAAGLTEKTENEVAWLVARCVAMLQALEGEYGGDIALPGALKIGYGRQYPIWSRSSDLIGEGNALLEGLGDRNRAALLRKLAEKSFVRIPPRPSWPQP